jgi:hypothetical protein
MSKILGILAAGMAMIALSWGSAWATATTHIWAPSTDVQPYKKWHITSDFYVPTENNSDDSRSPTVTNTGLTVGVLPFKNLNAEVGFDHKSGTGVDDYPMYFNTKVGIPENAYGAYFPALAAGIYDVGTENNKTNFDVWYVKAGKTFEIDKFSLGRVSLGAFQGNKKLLTYGDKASNKGILACWERTMTEISDKLWVAIEYQGSKSSYGTWNVGGSWKFSDNTALLLGYDFYNNKNLAGTYTVQVDIDF